MDRRKRLLCLYLLYLRKRRKQQRIHWVHPINQERDAVGMFNTLFTELRNNESNFFNYFGMSVESFDNLLERLNDSIAHQNTKMRDAIPPAERLAITIRYLSAGSTFTEMHYSHRMGVSTISQIVKSVCCSIWHVLQEDCIPRPSAEQLETTSEAFTTQAKFPHCVGAIGVKRMTIKRNRSAAYFSSGGETYSVVLMAIADCDYRFTFVGAGAYGTDSDSSLFKNASFWESLEKDLLLPLPLPDPLPGCDHPNVPYVLVADEACALSKHVMRPFDGELLNVTKRVFNLRLSKASRTAECAFGILSNKWKIFHRPLNVSRDFAVDIVKACCVLHNFLREREGYEFEHTLTIEGLEDIPPSPNVHGDLEANEIRNEFARYFMSEHGSLPWLMSRIEL